MARRQSRTPDLVVIEPLREWTCATGDTGPFLFMENGAPLCLTCADMDHLTFLPSGDATLTRCAKKESGLSAVVVRWSRTRKRYERQGTLVEEAALERAEERCLADEDVRRRRRERDRERRADEDAQFQVQMAKEIGGGSRAVRRSGPRRSPATPAPEEAAGSGDRRRRGPWTRKRSRSLWWRRFDTGTPTTTSC